MGKVFGTMRIGFKVASGVAAGYFVMKATEEKAQELVVDGGIANAFVIGFGQGALASAAALMTYYLVG